MSRREPMPEPWMFGTTVTVDGEHVVGEIVNFTLMARLRMKLRTMRGKPAIAGIHTISE